MGSDKQRSETIWMQGEGYAGSAGVMFVLCPRSLKIEYLKRYVGGLVVFDDLAEAYRVSRFFAVMVGLPMMGLKASRFVGSCFFGDMST